MPQTTLKQKAGLLLFSILITLFITEIIMRLTGAALLSVQNLQNLEKYSSQSTIKIMCIGESTTYLGGEDSYPSALQRALDADNNQRKFTVINQGVPGIDSAFILSNLPSWLDQYHPDVVISMIGINDAKEMPPAEKQTLEEQFSLFIKNLRVYKLARWLILKTTTELHSDQPVEAPAPAVKSILTEPPPSNAIAAEPPTKAPESFEQWVILKLKEKPPIYSQLYLAGLISMSQKNYLQAENIFRKLIDAKLGEEVDRLMYQKIGNMLLEQKKYNELVPIVESKIKANPFDPEATEWIPFLIRQDSSLAPAFINLLKEESRQHPKDFVYYDLIESAYTAMDDRAAAQEFGKKAEDSRKNMFAPRTKENYLKIIAILKERKIKHVLMQYPLRDVNTLKFMLQSAEDLTSLTFVDNKRIFEEAVKEHGYDGIFTDRCCGNFGHATPLGNKILAGNAAKAIRELFK